MSAEEACLEIAEWIRPRLSDTPEAHEAIIDKTLRWLGTSLNPPVDALFEDAPYSRRQVERLVHRYFGFPPRGLARKYRAIRAANLLVQTDLSGELEAEIACAFVDQPHMIREIRRFCGHTPARLGGESDLMFKQLTYMHNLDRFRPYRGLGSAKQAERPLV
jgi:methylphosphotriester-DNA--protein-cysteine methyltransferase